MTSTITPPSNVINLIRQDPKIRLADYCEAVRFYLGVPSKFINRIIFKERYPIKPLLLDLKLSQLSQAPVALVILTINTGSTD